ncbi:hypothetical protein K4L44_15065 [Halosquirtibacter laminarini]|uniref:Uncharacterized protein n=1 Tax=Halosquirtibacter laminarini TaxID=3374600 RepID=A0AC61NNG7_9BACT|nr:hypothetical protein K4L44_15065 [Prolixibacteraceae bacterium]
MVKTLGEIKNNSSQKEKTSYKDTVVTHCTQKRCRVTDKQIISRDKFRQCSHLLKKTKVVWKGGFHQPTDRGFYHDCFSYNMHHAFRWRENRWYLNPARVMLSKRIPGFQLRDFSTTIINRELLQIDIDKPYILNNFNGGFAIFLDDTGNDIFISDLEIIEENCFATIPDSFYDVPFHLHLSLYRRYAIFDIATKEVFDSIYLGCFQNS